MRIDDNLNLVLPVPRGAGSIYVHATPLSRETFEQHYLIIGKTFSAMMAEGLGMAAAPRLAALMLKDIATRAGTWEGVGGVANTLVQEIVRLSNVVLPADGGAGGWRTLPLHTALQQQMITDDERSHLMGALVFFMVNSAMHPRRVMAIIMESLNDLWGTQTTSFDATEFAASLPKSTPDAATDTSAAAAGALVPS